MSDLHIVIGNKNYSSWSLRGYLPLVATGQPFTEEKILLDTPGYREKIAALGAAGLVPVLRHGERLIWESLSICEYLAEQFPGANLWPADAGARALARSVSAEMHAGFLALREHCPMDFRARKPRPTAEALDRDVARVTELWRLCRERYGQGGDMLFGHFTVADCMYAPVVTRFQTYGVELDPVCAAYRDAVLALPAMEAWLAEARDEPRLGRYD